MTPSYGYNPIRGRNRGRNNGRFANIRISGYRLRTVAKPVTLFDAELKALVADMRETMYAAEGIGLAASQIDVHQRILVIDVSETKDSPRAYINPTFEVIDEELQDYDEGCLSVPGFYETVSRPRRVIIKAQDEEGAPFELEADGLLAKIGRAHV